MVKLKSKQEIEAMRRAGSLVARILEQVRQAAEPRVSTAALNALAEDLIAAAGAEPLFKGVRSTQAKFPYPAALCTSVNEEVVHGVPGVRLLAEGDILSVDCGVRLDGYCGDAAITIPVGKVRPEVERLLKVTLEALQIAVSEIRPNRKWTDVARRMQRHVEEAGFSVVREFVGHGIGRNLHEDPKVPNFVDRGTRSFDLVPGLVLAVEPMVNMGRPDVVLGDSTGWTVVTQDRSWAAHFEHTIAVTDKGSDVLTLIR
jgi:methionyl aminopeptidase